jgi:hypothetical protein
VTTVGDVMAPLFGPVDWERLLLPTTPLLETVIRGSFVYLALFALLRFVFRRESGAARISMLLLLVLLADAAQNAMADDYTSVTDGLLLVGTIMAWDYLLDWTASRFPAVQDLIHPRPLLLIRNGRILRTNLKRELVERGGAVERAPSTRCRGRERCQGGVPGRRRAAERFTPRTERRARR